MTKKQTKKKTRVVVQMPKTPRQRPAARKKTVSPFGPVSRLTTAPVAIGNSISGSRTAIVSRGKNGIMVRGRDFMFTPIGLSPTTWSLCGGTPLSPAAFADTTLANYMRVYAKFRFRQVVVHYITSSPTSSVGDIMFYYGKDRSSVFLNQTSAQLLGFVLSDPSTVIGPQWTNHSAVLNVTGGWKLTDYGMHAGVEEYADGELFLLSKTAANDCPGYVLFDYIIEFAEHQLQPRLLEFPIPRIQWHQCNIGVTTLPTTAGVTSTADYPLYIKGNGLNGLSSIAPSGNKSGDIYKMILDVTNSTASAWTDVLTSNLFVEVYGPGTNALTVSDGMTLYAVADSDTVATPYGFTLFPNAESAYLGNKAGSIFYGKTKGDQGITFNLQVWVSYIGSIGSKSLVPSY